MDNRRCHLYTTMNTHNPRHPTPYCRNICQEFIVKKKQRSSVYELNARCHNCEAYIPRDKIIDRDKVGVKARCPCCNKTWMKGVHAGFGLKRIKKAKPAIRFSIKSLKDNVSA